MSKDAAETTAPRRTRLLRVAEHIRTQNWTAIGIDFLIVVLGVFVSIQREDPRVHAEIALFSELER